MRRLLLTSLLGAYVLTVVGLVVAVDRLHHRPRPCFDTFQLVQEGMTLAEVEATVGCPPGDYRTREHEGTYAGPPFDAAWECDDAMLRVVFSPDGRVGHRQPEGGDGEVA